jgi:pimeloyl-ACP methyl ester carboxylesterase
MKIHTSDGATIHFEIRGEGEPLFLLHGFFGASGDWARFLDGFGLGRRLILPDLRGHGHSTNPEKRFLHRRCAGDLLAIADQLEIDRFAAIGLSGGGNTLLHVATLAPDRVTAMVVASATTHFPPQCRAWQRGFTLEMLGPEGAAAARARCVRGEEQLAALIECAHRFADDHDDLSFTDEKLAPITARTLVIAGDRDPLYPVEIAVALYRGIRHASLWVVPGAGHVPVFGVHAPAFVRETNRFLDEKMDQGAGSIG